MNNQISAHDRLLVAHISIFNVVLGTRALTGIHHTNHVIILVIPKPYTSRCDENATRVFFVAIFAEISVSNKAIIATHTDAVISVCKSEGVLKIVI